MLVVVLKKIVITQIFLFLFSLSRGFFARVDGEKSISFSRKKKKSRSSSSSMRNGERKNGGQKIYRFKRAAVSSVRLAASLTLDDALTGMESNG